MRAISLLSFDAGTSTRWCFAAALRMLVRKSAIGSVCITLLVVSSVRLPAGFRYAGDFSLERHAAEADTAHLKLANVGARAAADAATIAVLSRELRFALVFFDFCSACH